MIDMHRRVQTSPLRRARREMFISWASNPRHYTHDLDTIDDIDVFATTLRFVASKVATEESTAPFPELR